MNACYISTTSLYNSGASDPSDYFDTIVCVSDSSQAVGCFTDVTRRRVDSLVGSAYRCFATPKRLFFGINKESSCYLKHLML